MSKITSADPTQVYFGTPRGILVSIVHNTNEVQKGALISMGRRVRRTMPIVKDIWRYRSSGTAGRADVECESRKTLWWIHHYAVSPDMPETIRQWELATLIKEDGWDATIYATGFNHKTRAYDRPISLYRPILEVDEQGVKFVWLYTSPYDSNDWRRYVNMVSFLCISVVVGVIRRGPNAVIGTTPHLLAGFAAWMVAKRHQVPFILEVQDLWPESIAQLGVSNRLVLRSLEALERFLYGQADHIIALAEGIQEGIIARDTPDSKVSLISNAVMRPLPVDPKERTIARASLGWEGKIVAIWVGAHGPANGIDTLVESARSLQHRRDIQFVFIGDGPEKRSLMQQAGALENVAFFDPVPKSEVATYLRAADIGLMNSRRFKAFEGARPNKLFDYMSAALPIVASMPGEAMRLVMEANCGVEAMWEDHESIATGVVRLADNPALRKELGLNGFEYLSHNHTRENTAKQLINLLTGVIG